jgi:hypothetical protein
MPETDEMGYDRRVTDAAVIQLQQQFLDHAKDDAQWRLEQDKRWEHLDKNWLELVSAQHKNTEAIEKLITSIADMSDMARTYRDFQGVTRLGKGAQGFCLWLLKWGFIGAGIVSIIVYVANYFTAPPAA